MINNLANWYNKQYKWLISIIAITVSLFLFYVWLFILFIYLLIVQRILKNWYSSGIIC